MVALSLLGLMVLALAGASVPRTMARTVLYRVSRLLVSGRRRPAPTPPRRGGLGGLEAPLAQLVQRGREVEAAIEDLDSLREDYRRSLDHAGLFTAPADDQRSLAEERRLVGIRRDFEDAVVHVTQALHRWQHQREQLDARAQARLGAGAPRIRALLVRFPWLPRAVYQTGPLHFRDDVEDFEAALAEVGSQLRRCEEELLFGRESAYR